MLKLYIYIFFLLLFQSYCLQDIRVQLKWYHQFQFAGCYQAKEQGFYKDLGFDVEFIERQADKTSIQSVLDGRAEFGIGSTDVLYSYLNGDDIVLVSTLYQYNPLILASHKGKKFQDPKNYNNSRLMLNAQKFDSLPVLKMLEKSGVNINTIQSVPYDFQKIINKKIDDIDGFIVYLSDISRYQKVYKDKISFLKPVSYGVNFYGDLLFSTKSYTKKHPILTQKFKEATINGWKYALSHPKQTIDLIRDKYNSNLDERELFLEYEATKNMIQENLIPIGFSNKERWDKIADSFFSLKLLNKKKRKLKDFYFEIDQNKVTKLDILHLVVTFLLILLLVKQIYNFVLKKARSRKKLESDLDIAKDHLSSIQGFAAVSIWSYDISLDKFHFSKVFENLLKEDLDYIKLKFVDILKYVHPDDRKLFTQYFDQLKKGGNPFESTFKIIGKDNVQRHFKINGYLDQTKENKTTRIQGEIIDVTELVAQEQQMRLTRFSIDNSSELMIWLDNDGKIFDLNKSANRALSINEESLIGKYLSDIHDGLIVENLIEKIATISHLGFIQTEISLILENSEVSFFEVIASLVSYESNDYIYLSFRDINERKGHENQLIFAKKRAEAGEIFKSNLLATMSHEFHTPMNAIVGFSSLLTDSSKEEQKEYIYEITKNSCYLLDLLNGTLLYSKISETDIKLEEINLKEVLEITCMEMYELVKKTSITLDYYCSDNLPLLVNIDISLFSNLLKNLLNNAIKFSKTGKIIIDLSYSEDLKDFSSPFLTLKVKDQGIGIASLQVDKVFKPFYQVDSSYKREQSGTGMGLAVCQKIVECLGGTIKVKSELNKGSEFIVCFPLITFQAIS